MKHKQIHLLCSIILSALLIIAALCLMVACVGIYNAGDQPFSREAVATAFRRISIPVYICLAGVLAGFLLDILLPGSKVTPPIAKPYGKLLSTWLQKVDPELCNPETKQEIQRLEKKRKLHSFLCGFLLGGCSAVFLIYATNSSNFHDSDINGSVIRAVKILLASMSLPLAFGIYSSFYSISSLRKEIDLLKSSYPAAQRVTPLPREMHSSKSYARILRVVVLCAALVFLLLGFFTGGTADVMTKAINICTECVGLG